MTDCVDIFLNCYQAICQNIQIKRVSHKDQEFHFQNWFEDRLKELDVKYKSSGRNSYPDFELLED